MPVGTTGGGFLDERDAFAESPRPWSGVVIGGYFDDYRGQRRQSRDSAGLNVAC